jgi:carbon-monoxide dehydrogenase large subunit
VLNPLLVEGQQHGGIASGVGQALYEEVRFDTDGNPVTSNFADYAVPSAAELPSFDARSTETPIAAQPTRREGDR